MQVFVDAPQASGLQLIFTLLQSAPTTDLWDGHVGEAKGSTAKVEVLEVVGVVPLGEEVLPSGDTQVLVDASQTNGEQQILKPLQISQMDK